MFEYTWRVKSILLYHDNTSACGLSQRASTVMINNVLRSIKSNCFYTALKLTRATLESLTTPTIQTWPSPASEIAARSRTVMQIYRYKMIFLQKAVARTSLWNDEDIELKRAITFSVRPLTQNNVQFFAAISPFADAKYSLEVLYSLARHLLRLICLLRNADCHFTCECLRILFATITNELISLSDFYNYV